MTTSAEPHDHVQPENMLKENQIDAASLPNRQYTVKIKKQRLTQGRFHLFSRHRTFDSLLTNRDWSGLHRRFSLPDVDL
ncbi:hypothetical protein [Sphingobium aquiterrae]|uniref:hypothetical protein n=1 Tax=Sphingobium aquiterrae TaxID=2038656 RepID=UPI00301A5D13